MIRTSGKMDRQPVFMINTGRAKKLPSAVSDFSHLKDVAIPGDKLEAIKIRASTAMKETLRPKILKAIAFFKSQKKLLDVGTLDSKTFAAETAAATAALMVADALKEIFIAAKRDGDAESLTKLHAAALVLADRIKDSTLSGTTYPLDATTKNSLMGFKLATAQEIWKDVTEAIGNAPQKLGVGFSRCPD